MAYGNAQRAWTYAEYVKEYEQLQAKNDKLIEACKSALWLLTVLKKEGRLLEYPDARYSTRAKLKAALAEAEK